MENIHKLPFVIGVSVTIVVGMISYKTGVEYGEIYIRMFISMVVFFVAGIYLKNFIIKIHKELKQKEEEEERLKEEKLKQEKLKQQEENNEKGKTIDLKVEEEHVDKQLYDEEFTPLKVNTIDINKKVEEWNVNFGN